MNKYFVLESFVNEKKLKKENSVSKTAIVAFKMLKGRSAKVAKNKSVIRDVAIKKFHVNRSVISTQYDIYCNIKK